MGSRRSLSLLCTLLAAGLVLTSPSSAAPPGLSCEITGQGFLADGDHGVGRVLLYDDFHTEGHWVHRLPQGCEGVPGHGCGADIVLFEPELALCRINGVAIGTFRGEATVNGVGGFDYVVSVEDRGTRHSLERDRYRIQVTDAAGNVVTRRDGLLVRGDMAVLQWD